MTRRGKLARISCTSGALLKVVAQGVVTRNESKPDTTSLGAGTGRAEAGRDMEGRGGARRKRAKRSSMKKIGTDQLD